MVAARREQGYVFFAVLAAVALAAVPGSAQSWSPYAISHRPTLADLRNKMVDDDIVAEGVKNPRVIEAMRKTPRHEFVPLGERASAYFDMALPIGEGQTISPPFIVAYMTEAIDPQPDDRVLEIGTGSGYQAAVLSKLVAEVYTIEIVSQLGQTAAKTLQRLHYSNVHVKIGDGYAGWPEHAPFDKIIVTCSPEKVPQALVEQLKEGGRMVVPVGQRYQQTLYLLRKSGGKMEQDRLLPTIFVPMTGEAEKQRKVLPDPARPAVENGDFEEVFGTPPQPKGWHYQRQLEMSVAAEDAPSGKNYVTFHNAEAGRASQALQIFALDGRKVKAVELSVHVRGHKVRAGQSPQQLPVVGLTFYDENRVTIEEKLLGPWSGTFGWREEKQRIDVPSRAREALVRIGLFGALGELSVDDVKLTVVK